MQPLRAVPFPRFPSSLRVAALVAVACSPVPRVGAQTAMERAGVEAWAKGDHAAALAIWRPAALSGDADAQYNLAQAYKTGRGVTLDLDEAERWLTLAARQGHPEAEADLGVLLFARNKREAAVPWLTRAAARGERRSQYLMGTAHFNGDLAPRDWPRAYALTKRASDQGLDVAASRLAQLDELIPLEDRRAGLALAMTLEADERRVRLGGPAPAAPVAVAAVPSPKAVPAQSTRPAPARTATPAPRPAQPPAPTRVAPAVEAARPVQPATGPWRVQLGAFGSAAAARTAWTRLAGRLSALAALPHQVVSAGSVHRLQAGGFADRVAADRLCAQVNRSGADCFVVRR